MLPAAMRHSLQVFIGSSDPKQKIDTVVIPPSLEQAVEDMILAWSRYSTGAVSEQMLCMLVAASGCVQRVLPKWSPWCDVPEFAKVEIRRPGQGPMAASFRSCLTGRQAGYLELYPFEDRTMAPRKYQACEVFPVGWELPKEPPVTTAATDADGKGAKPPSSPFGAARAKQAAS